LAQDFDVGNLEEMNKVIEQMMGELTSKEVLYEPFSELVDKVCQVDLRLSVHPLFSCLAGWS
jgi:hypothetical protein